MTKHEVDLLEQFIERHLEVLGNSGCNDYILENTAENRNLVCEAEVSHCSYWPEGKNIITSDFIVLNYLWRKAKKELTGD